jgi:hypothetical protein
MKRLSVVLALMACLGCGFAGAWCSEAQDVAYEQTRPRELLRKYEWFKDAAAQLDKKAADLSVYDARLAALAGDYAKIPRAKWPRDDREQFNLWATEAAGVKASYNALAAEYNAQMAKDNWRFCNRGTLPPGVETPLPREFRAYLGQ